MSLTVTDLARAKRFYGDVLGLAELQRPDFDFAGAWYALGDRQLHLIESLASICGHGASRSGNGHRIRRRGSRCT